MLVIVWIFVFCMMIRAVRTKQILWPQKQEDREESDWTLQRTKSQPKTKRRRTGRKGDGQEFDLDAAKAEGE